MQLVNMGVPLTWSLADPITPNDYRFQVLVLCSYAQACDTDKHCCYCFADATLDLSYVNLALHSPVASAAVAYCQTGPYMQQAADGWLTALRAMMMFMLEQEAEVEVELWKELKDLQLSDPLPHDMPQLFYTRLHSLLLSGCYADRIRPFLQEFAPNK